MPSLSIQQRNLYWDSFPQLELIGKKVAARQIWETWKMIKYEKENNLHEERKIAQENKYQGTTPFRGSRHATHEWSNMPERKKKRFYQEWSPTRNKIIKPLRFKTKVKVKKGLRVGWKDTERRDGTHTVNTHFADLMTRSFDKKIPVNEQFWLFDGKKSEFHDKFEGLFEKATTIIKNGGKFTFMQGGSPIKMGSIHLTNLEYIYEKYKEL